MAEAGQVIKFELRLHPLLKMLLEASATTQAKIAAQLAEAGIELADFPKEFLCLDCDAGVAAGTGNLAILLKPSDGFCDFLSAALARDLDGLAVEQAGHGENPDQVATAVSYLGLPQDGEAQNG